MSINKERQKRKIQEIWGKNDLSIEIEEVFAQNNLDLFKLIACCKKKGQRIEMAVAAILGLVKDFDVVIQCKCGEVFGFNQDVYEQFKKCSGNEVIKCKRCDPRFQEKLTKAIMLLGHKGPIGQITWLDEE